MATEKRQKILDTAMSLFIENGIQGTATSLIAKEAGVATGTLFHHFPTKEDLVNALYHSIYEQVKTYHLDRYNPNTDVRDRIRQIWYLDIRWALDHPEYSHFLEHYSVFFYASEPTIQETYERFYYCMDNVQEGLEKNLFKIDCEDYIINHYIWNIRMNMVQFLKLPHLATEENLEKTFEIYWGGIALDEH